ncbi:MAG: (d)CMP kinase [Clostridia bacterium]|nr:(d)CMP kinase [Clostridia bacterium]
MKKPLTIAIDGPSGAGKSSVADVVCEKLGILHLDTGAMYRAIGLCALEMGIDPGDETAVSLMCEESKARVDVAYHDGVQATYLNGRDVSSLIRTQEVGGAASTVSRYPAVRTMLVRRQQEMAAAQPMLLDGRDIGTVVLPDATVKIFLTATAEERARRRMLQLQEKGDTTPFETVLAEVNARDLQDTTRSLTPLRQAEDAVLLDATNLTFDETVAAVMALVEEKYGK